ncbi:MAG: membrane protein [Lysobacteraceae bacterium]|nr:MAG: membrane protein [Xanthomonadaceae bacterium]
MTDFIGYAAGLMLALCFLPQVIKSWRTKQVDDVSMGMLLLSLGSASLYEIYAWQLGLTPVVIMNAVFGVLIMIEISLKLIYGRSKANS